MSDQWQKKILSKQEKVSEWDDMNIHNDEICNKSKIFDICINHSKWWNRQKIRQLMRQTLYQNLQF